ncbi:MAG: hypothetical protein ACRERV_06075 [Methylococcales bacterium]
MCNGYDHKNPGRNLERAYPEKRRALDVQKFPNQARRIEDEMVRGVYNQHSVSEQTTLDDALDRYLKEVTPCKKSSTQTAEKKRVDQLRIGLGSSALAAITPVIVADYRDSRLDV